MKAMIFAAGLGTRLRPLTDHTPKALIPLGDKPLLQLVIEHLINYGIKDIVVNTHYLGERIVKFLHDQDNFGIHIGISDESNQLLETGGGLWKVRDFFDDEKPFLVCNADVLTNIDIDKFYKAHTKNKSIATLAVRNRRSSRLLLFDKENILCGWKNVKTDEKKQPRPGKNLQELAFSGYHIISPEIFKYPTRQGVFSMTDWYLDICAEQKISAYEHNNDVWVDIGSPESLEEAKGKIKELKD